MKRVIFVLAIAVLALMSGRSEVQGAANRARSAAGPSVDEILSRHIQALGGKAAIEKITSRVAKGTVEVTAVGLSGTTLSYAKAPNKAISVLNLGGAGAFQEGFDGVVGWSSSPVTGMRETSGSELAFAKRDADFYADLKLKELFAKLTLVGTEKVGDRQAYVIEMTPSVGAPEKRYFDSETWLLLRRDFEVDSPEGKQSTQVFFEDYRAVDGVKVSFVQRLVVPMATIVIKLQEVKHNVPIEDSKFRKPA